MSTSLFDDTLHARLNDVPLPAGLLAKLHAVPLGDDTDLDSALADVALPPGLMRRLTRTANDRGHWARPLLHAAAALLVFAASLGYALSAVAFVCGRFEERPSIESALFTLVSAIEPHDEWPEECSIGTEPPVVEISAPTIEDGNLPVEDGANPIRSSETPWRKGRSPWANRQPSGSVAATMPSPTSVQGLALADWQSSTEGSLYHLAPIDRTSVQVAKSQAIDLRFWRQSGVLPWLDVQENHGIVLPLVESDLSYRLVRRSIRSGRLPAAAEIRCEEFLAGIDYGLESKRAGQPLMLAAAPSPFAAPWRDMRPDSATTSRWLLLVATTLSGQAPHGDDPAARFRFGFSSEHVSAYRVVGYAPPANASSTSPKGLGEESKSTAPGVVRVVLCEIELRHAYRQQVELVRIALDGVADDGPQTTVLRSDMFSPDFESAPVIWQQAALVALAAERFAGSPCAAASLREIAALARQIEPLVHDRAGWRDFVDLLVRAQTLRGSLLRAF